MPSNLKQPLEAAAGVITGIDTSVSVLTAAAIMLHFAGFLMQCRIDVGHDAIEMAFKKKMAELARYGFRQSLNLEPLFRHIAAEKERCALEIAKHLQERGDGKEGKRRSSVNVSDFRRN